MNRPVEAGRAERDARLPSEIAVSRAITALAGILSRHSGGQLAFELATNCATAILGGMLCGEERPVAVVLHQMLAGRRRVWPNSVWGSLTDAGIDTLSAAGAQAWERALREARAA